MGAALLGPPGGLIRLPGSSSLQVAAPERNVTRTALSGRVTAQRLPRGRRVWEVGVGAARPEDYTLLEQLEGGALGFGPFVFYDELAQVTNLLTPVQSTLQSGLWSGGSTGGAGVAGDGTRYLRSLVVGSPGTIALVDDVPVPANTAVTVSAYAATTTGGSLVVEEINAAGTVANTPGAGQVPASGTARRTHTSFTTGASTTALRIRATSVTLLTMPAVTLTPGVQPWGTGGGCTSAVFNMGGTDVLMAFAARNNWGRRASYTMTVHEVT